MIFPVWRMLAVAALLDVTGFVTMVKAASVNGPHVMVGPGNSLLLRVSGDDNNRYERRHYRRHYHGREANVAVEIGRDVVVDAPFTHIGVTPAHVRVRAPFVDLSIPR
jgi:hypothetical protein